MPQFYIPVNNAKANNFLLDEQESHHALNVFRLSKGSDINLFDGEGGIYLGEITGAENGIVRGRVKSKSVKLYDVNITLFAPVIKQERFEWIIEKSVELGASRIVPLITSRTEFVPKGKTPRWKKIIMASAKQSMAPVLAEITEPVEYKTALEISRGMTNIIFCIDERLKILSPLPPSAAAEKKLGLWVGPEGGFTKEETELAVKNNFLRVSLGGNILRSETACAAALAVFGRGEG